MNSLVSFLEKTDGSILSSASTLEELLTHLLRYKEGKANVNEAELFALRFWILKKACLLKTDEIASVESKCKPDMVVSTWNIENRTVCVSDSEDIMEVSVSEIAWL